MEPTHLTNEEADLIRAAAAYMDYRDRSETKLRLLNIITMHTAPMRCESPARAVLPSTTCQRDKGHPGEHAWGSADHTTTITWVNVDG